MPGHQVEYASSEEIATLVALQAEIHNKINRLHYPLQNFFGIFSGFHINFKFSIQVFKSKYLFSMWRLYRFFLAELSSQQFPFSRTQEKMNFDKIITNELSKISWSNSKEELIQKGFCKLFETGSVLEIINAAVIIYPNIKIINHILQACELMFRGQLTDVDMLETVLNKKSQIILRLDKYSENTIREMDDIWEITSYLMLIEKNGAYELPLVLGGLAIGVYVSSQLCNIYLRKSPFGLLSLISRDYAKDQECLKAITISSLKMNDYRLQRNNLIALRDKLINSEAQQRKYARIISLLLFPVLYMIFNKSTDYMQIEEYSWMIALSVFTIVVSNVYLDVSEYFENNNYSKQIEQRQLLLNQLAKMLQQKVWILHEEKSLSSAQFILKVEDATLSIANHNFLVARKDILNALLFALLKNDFPLLNFDYQRIFLNAKRKITAGAKSAAADNCLDYIARIQKSNKLALELEIICNKLNIKSIWFVEDNTVEGKLPEFAFHIILNQEDLEKVKSILNKFVDSDFISTQPGVEENTTQLSLNAIVEIDLKKLHRELKAYISVIPAAQLSGHAAPKRKAQRKIPVPAQPIETLQVVRPAPAAATTIKFSSGIFSSQTPESSDIKEMKSPYWPRYSHFGLFAVKEGDFPDRSQFINFKGIFNKGQLVPPKGHSGIVQDRHYVRGNDGGWHLMGYKIKDTEDDLRVFEGRREVDGRAVLHVFDTVVPKAHR